MVLPPRPPLRVARLTRKVSAAILLAALLSAGPARADLEVWYRQDRVELVDGTVIECFVVISGPRGAVVVMEDKARSKPKEAEKAEQVGEAEKTEQAEEAEKQEVPLKQEFIPADVIRRIVRGENNGEKKGFQTALELAHKVIRGTGFRPGQQQAAPAQQQARPGQPAVPGAPAPAAPVLPAQPRILPATPPTPGQPQAVAPAIKPPPKEVAEAYLTRFPELRAAAERLLGTSANVPAEIQKLIESDPAARPALEEFLGAFFQPAQPLLRSPGMTTPGRKAGGAYSPKPKVKPPPPADQQKQD